MRSKSLFLIFLLTLLAVAKPSSAAERVLMVVSSAGASDPGLAYDFDELAMAYAVFVDNGVQVDIASPAGGEPVAEPSDPRMPHVARFHNDAAAMKALQNSIPLADVRPDYAAVFVVGGAGAGADLPASETLQRLIADTYKNGEVVGGVCHGPAVLANVELDGRKLIQGRRVSAFTNAEAKVFAEGGDEHSVEDRLSEAGAVFEPAAVASVHAVTDGRIVTGQNPFSSARTAEAMLRAMGKNPVPRDLSKIEMTMELVRVVAEQSPARAERLLAGTPELYEPKLLAMLGYQFLAGGADEAGTQHALALMELSTPYFQHPRLSLAMADAYVSQGAHAKATAVLASLVEKDPDNREARDKLAALTE